MSATTCRRLAAATILASLGAGAAATAALRRRRPSLPRPHDEPLVPWRTIPNLKQ